jgi:hypothetical protein
VNVVAGAVIVNVVAGVVSAVTLKRSTITMLLNSSERKCYT